MKSQKILNLVTGMVLLSSLSVYAGDEGDAQSNTFYGDFSGDSLDGSGSYNVFIGYASGNKTTGGDRNNFIGSYSGYSNTTGFGNIFNGYQSGYANTNGSYNTFSGESSGKHNTTADGNVFTGYRSGLSNTTGHSNVFSGKESGYSNTTANFNVFNGYNSGYSNTDGYNNNFSGYNSGYSNTTGVHNIFYGSYSGYSNTEGNYNTFNGNSSGYNNIIGNGNVFNGYESGYSNTEGNYNTFTGYKSGSANLTGNGNVFNGYYSGYNAHVNNSVFLGYKSGYYATRNNTLYIDNTSTNTPLIYGEFDTSIVVINGELNTTKAITASFEGATSKQALKMMDISVNNTDTNVKSDVGFAMTNAREGFTWSFRTWEEDNGFAISKYGNGANKEFRLYDTDPDDASTVVLELANGAWCDGVWHNTSSRNMKQDIEPLSTKEALEAFKKLQPVTYAYKSNPTDPKVGFIAEDVPELVADPKHKSLSAMDMVALLTKVVQAKDVEMAEMKAEQKLQAEKIAKIESLLTNLALETSNKDKNQLSVNLK